MTGNSNSYKRPMKGLVIIEYRQIQKKGVNMETIFNYDSPSIALDKLREKGYTKDFNQEFDELFDYTDDYTIDYLYRYEGATDPGDESTVYGIRNEATGAKGVFVAGDLSLIEGRKRDIIINLEIRAKKGKDNGQ